MITIKNAGPPLTNELIEEFETALKVRLPDQYRRFLLRTNGGSVSKESDTVDIEGAPWSPTDVHVFYGIGYDIRSYDLDWNRLTLSERIPSTMLPIACDSGGGGFCLALQGRNRGAILFCDLQSVAFDYEAIPAFYPVAPDFDAFLEKIRPFEP